MNIRILELTEGAAAARGLTVIIDVFRAASLEYYLADMGAAQIRPVGSVEDTFALGKRIPGSLLIGERGGVMVEGFDYGNSPSSIRKEDIRGKTVLHTTSAGTQGIVHASGADEIIWGSLVGAKAAAEYIRRKDPQEISLVAMGNGGIRRADEDVLCAEYIRSLLTGSPVPGFRERLAGLRSGGGAHFFDPSLQHIYPEADFHLCVRCDVFPFVLRVEKDGTGFISRRVPVPG